MNALREQLAQETAAVAIFGTLFFAGLGCLGLFIAKASDRRNRQFPPLSPWRISGFDFTFFFVLLTLWFVLAGQIVVEAWRLIFDPATEAGLPMSVKIVAGLVLQLGMLFLFLRFRQTHQHLHERPLSERPLSLSRASGQAAFGYVALFPVIGLLSATWVSLLEWLKARGLGIQLTSQDPVRMFNEIESPVWLLALVLVTIVLAPIAEEHVFRGGIYRYFRGRFGFAAAALVASLLFALVHFNLQSFGGLLAIGIGLAVAYEVTGNLKVPILMHAFHNGIQVVVILLIRLSE